MENIKYAHIQQGNIYLFDQQINDLFEAEESSVGFRRGKSFINFLLKQPVEVQARIKKIKHAEDGVTVVITPAILESY